MARDKQLHEKRNEAVKQAYERIKKQQPKWRYQEWLNHVADQFFLDSKTISKIIHGTYEREKEKEKHQSGQISIYDQLGSDE
ncbi:MAG: hypothetical protein H6606_05955 [Flavobacteriales bacterium]|nr:hypothetical protein [Flavobacteriales bacterium]